MKVLALGRVAATTLLWHSQESGPMCTVVCKANFELQPDHSPLTDAPAAPQDSDQYWNDNHQCSLQYATDRVPAKRGADVILVGEAIAPGDLPARSWTTRLAVGSIDKRIDVFCDRRWNAAGTLVSGDPIGKLDLYWEHAAGGPDSWNPVGVVTSAGDGMRIPNLQPHGLTLRGPTDPIVPCCYAAIAPHWPSRTARLQRHRAAWSHDAWADMPVPADFDWAYFNAAPHDQQLPQLIGDEPIVLEHLVQGTDRFTTRLEPLQPRLTIKHGSESLRAPLVCDTLHIDTHAMIASLTWRTSVARVADRPIDMILVSESDAMATAEIDNGSNLTVAVSDNIGRKAGNDDPYPLAGPGAVRKGSGSQAATADLTSLRADDGAGVPWAGPTNETLHADKVPEHVVALLQSLGADAALDGDATLTVSADPTDGDVLPFEASQTDGAIAMPSAAVAMAHEPAPAIGATVAADSLTALLGSAAALTGQAPVAAPKPPDPLVAVAAPADATPAKLHAGNPAASPTADIAPVADITEPSMIGPLATPEMIAAHRAARDAKPDTPPDEDEAATESTAVEPSEPGEAEPPSLPLDEYPLPRCAAIAAALHCRPSERGPIMDEHQLDEPMWQRLEQHYDALVMDGIQMGKLQPMRDYDTAYVEQLEQERGEITVDEYARLRVAAERGTRDQVMQELRLPPPSLMRVQRVWMGRTIASMALTEQVEEAVEVARGG